jgi:hypothetical protein
MTSTEILKKRHELEMEIHIAQLENEKEPDHRIRIEKHFELIELSKEVSRLSRLYVETFKAEVSSAREKQKVEVS